MIKNKILLSENFVDPDPFIQFEHWYRDQLSSRIPVPNYVSLGTATKNGYVSLRIVLLKEFNKKGFVFFSNYQSRKGTHLESNPSAALLLYWPESARQIRIEGTVCKVSPKESDLYFNSRPEENRIAAWASDQSSTIPDRQYLEDRFEFFRNKFNNKPIARPPVWGGYRLIPSWFEFWQERTFRLHDRITYTQKAGKWVIERLAP